MLLRWWDGYRWTEHTQLASPGQGASGRSTTTPDGVPLAGWWHRVGASMLDGLILLPLGLLLSFPWVREIVDVYGDYFGQLTEDLEAGRTSTVSDADLAARIARPLAIVTLISLLVSFAYHVGFLMWRQATPGKLITGLRVRMREQPGPMPLGAVLLRWLTQSGVGVLSLLPYVGSLVGLYNLLDSLWPLWDGKKQAIHDKAAGTNVVRVG